MRWGAVPDMGCGCRSLSLSDCGSTLSLDPLSLAAALAFRGWVGCPLGLLGTFLGPALVIGGREWWCGL